MRQILLFITLLAISLKCFGQTRSDINQLSMLGKINKAINDSATNDDKKNFTSYFNAISNLVTQDSSSTLLINTSIYSFFKIIDSDKYAIGTNFIRDKWMRDCQLNLGLSPQTQTTTFSNFIKSFQLGITYAIINNKVIPKRYYNDAELNKQFNTRGIILDSVNAYMARAYADKDSVDVALIQQFIDSPPSNKSDITLPKQFKDYLKNILGIHQSFYDIVKTNLDTIYTQYQNKLKTRPLLTVSCNSFYDEINGRWKNIDFSENFSYFPSARKKTSISLTAKFSIQNDTAINNELNQGNNLFRDLFNSSLNANVPLNLWASRTLLEIKPAFTYAHIFSGIFKGEEMDKFTGQIIFGIDITKTISIPFSLVYDIKNPQFLGFLSLQYSF